MNFVQEAMGDADAILFVTDLFETEFANTQVKRGESYCVLRLGFVLIFPPGPCISFGHINSDGLQ